MGGGARAWAARAKLAELGASCVVTDPAQLPPSPSPSALCLALKPQVMDGSAPAYARWRADDTLVLSIAAGKPIAAFERYYGGSGVPVIRAMPNTPAAIGRGASVLCANRAATAADRAFATTLLQAVGEVSWVEDEGLMHAVTALSGSGPAYLFLLIEAMASAGERLGLPAETAMRAGAGRPWPVRASSRGAKARPPQLSVTMSRAPAGRRKPRSRSSCVRVRGFRVSWKRQCVLPCGDRWSSPDPARLALPCREPSYRPNHGTRTIGPGTREENHE